MSHERPNFLMYTVYRDIHHCIGTIFIWALERHLYLGIANIGGPCLVRRYSTEMLLIRSVPFQY